MKKKLIIIVTVPVVLQTWLKGQAKFLSQYYEVEIITSNSNNIDNIQKYENVNINIVDFNRKINIFKDLKVLLQLLIYFFKVKPSIIYTLTPKAGLLGMIAGFFAKVPNRIHNVVGLPHLEATGKRKIILEYTEKLTYFFSTKLFCNSLNLRDIISSMTKKNVYIIGNGSVNGVDTNYFKDVFSIEEKKKNLAKLGLNNNDFIITFVGRIVKDKGINELVSVFERLSTKYNFLKLLLIGDYKNESDIVSDKTQQIIKNNNSIIYLEFKEDIREYLAISSLFVLPSYREGLPNSLIEAGSFGIPLLATNINGCNEIIDDGITGILVEKKSAKKLEEAIDKLLEDKELYNSIKLKVRDRIIEKYEQKYFWNELKNEIKKSI